MLLLPVETIKLKGLTWGGRWSMISCQHILSAGDIFVSLLMWNHGRRYFSTALQLHSPMINYFIKLASRMLKFILSMLYIREVIGFKIMHLIHVEFNPLSQSVVFFADTLCGSDSVLWRSRITLYEWDVYGICKWIWSSLSLKLTNLNKINPHVASVTVRISFQHWHVYSINWLKVDACCFRWVLTGKGDDPRKAKMARRATMEKQAPIPAAKVESSKPIKREHDDAESTGSDGTDCEHCEQLKREAPPVETKRACVTSVKRPRSKTSTRSSSTMDSTGALLASAVHELRRERKLKASSRRSLNHVSLASTRQILKNFVHSSVLLSSRSTSPKPARFSRRPHAQPEAAAGATKSVRKKMNRAAGPLYTMTLAAAKSKAGWMLPCHFVIVLIISGIPMSILLVSLLLRISTELNLYLSKCMMIM